MRALVDANVYLSFLLSPDRPTPPALVVRAGLNRAYTLLVTAGVVQEFRDKSENKPYLAARITQHQTDKLALELAAVAETVPELPPPLPQIGNDRKDDYLFAHAIFGEADYLVSGDTGVQKIGHIGDVRIVSPAGFLQVLGLRPPNSGQD